MTFSVLDPLGAFLSLSATYFFIQASKKAWVLSIAAILINSFLYWQKGIYGQMGLEGLYLLSSIYGWIHWGRKKDKTTLPIRSMPRQLIWYGLPVMALTIYILTSLLNTFTDSSIALWDAATTMLALSAQWMTCRKWIESWIVWFIVDINIVLLHWIKGIPFHSAIHFIYLGMAIAGYLSWTKRLNQQPPLVTKELAY